MNSANQINTSFSDEAVETARSLRKLYFTRVAFSVLWIISVVTLGKTNSTAATLLFIIYPAWDVLATFFDIKANSANTNKTPQYVNAGISILTTIAVIVALQKGIPEALIVFGVWASLTGIIQLILGLRRRKYFEGQWPMILSGAQSVLAGGFIIYTAHVAVEGVVSLAGYSAFGAFYFLLAAIRLGKTIKNSTAIA
ncbi:DUF308 domain-containing protein [Mucilaginibacter pocheonensis]|uniref:DUF308 domain-containing protein n=1 Tax=Mucilaginibacter pocheonensis TaxID=398050 RepID=A0ABU1TF05_9SPHI|nr:DUF308 domain-containing protein [Mucilaginibacter pocheonensis]MDR6943913.1 hypothetical protein [Mucilaginibacter pocheonensis]